MAEHRTSMKHEKERETKRLQVENQYLKLILDKLYKSIMVGESTPQMEAKLPEDLRTDQALIELTTNIEKVHQKFHELETEMCDIHRQISQFSFMILGDDRSEERTPAKINKFTATGRQPRSNPVQRTGEAEQSLKLDKYLELVASAWIDMKEKEKKLQDDLNKKEKIIVKVQAKTERDEVQNKTTAEGNNGKQQNYSEPALPQEQDSSDKIPVMTSEEENNLRYLEERETLRRECERHCKEMDTLKGKLKHCEHLLYSLEEEKRNNQKTIIGLREEKDELLNRMSKIASDRLTHENTDITDLSDETRPSKLAEKMSELYDNQWTSAFDELKTNAVVDENAIGILLKIVMETNQVCKEMTYSHHQKLKEACTCFEYSSSTDAENKEKGKIITKGNISIETQQDIKSIWRESSKKVLKKVSPIIREKVAEKFEFPLLQMTQTVLYMKECVELCWMMNLQEKPMHLDISVLEKYGHPWFDTEKFRSYTKTGQHVAFVVWPALYLFDGGSLLKKGVAQGLKVEKGTSGKEHSSMPRS